MRHKKQKNTEHKSGLPTDIAKAPFTPQTVIEKRNHIYSIYKETRHGQCRYKVRVNIMQNTYTGNFSTLDEAHEFVKKYYPMFPNFEDENLLFNIEKSSRKNPIPLAVQYQIMALVDYNADMLNNMVTWLSKTWPEVKICESAKLKDVLDLYLAKKAQEVQPGTYGNHLKQLREHLLSHFGNIDMRSITTKGVMEYIEAGLAREYLSNFFGFAASRGFVTRNFVKDLPKANPNPREYSIATTLRLDAVINMFYYAYYIRRDYKLCVTLALMCFVGMRPYEVINPASIYGAKTKDPIMWDAIQKNYIYMRADMQKCGGSKPITMLPPNLWAWLNLIPQSQRNGMIGFNQNEWQLIRQDIIAFLKKTCAPLTQDDLNFRRCITLAPDIMRHTFCTIGGFVDREWAVSIARHTIAIDKRHYQGSCFNIDEEAGIFFRITPQNICELYKQFNKRNGLIPDIIHSISKPKQPLITDGKNIIEI